MRTFISLLLLPFLLGGCVANPVQSAADQPQTPLQTQLEGVEQAEFLKDYAALLTGRGNYPEATRILEELRRDDPDDLEVTRQLARVYEYSGRTELALVAWETIRRQSGDNLNDAAEYARVALLNKRFDLAEEVYLLWLERAPPDSPRTLMALNNLGYSRLLQGDYAGARRWFERTLEQDPLHPRARANLELTRRLEAADNKGETP